MNTHNGQFLDRQGLLGRIYNLEQEIIRLKALVADLEDQLIKHRTNEDNNGSRQTDT